MKKTVLFCILISTSVALWGQIIPTRRIYPWEMIKNEAAKGDAFAQTLVGRTYFHGSDEFFNSDITLDTKVEADATQAVYWFRKAAEQGISLAQGMLGACYYEGIGIEKDGNLALFWLEKAVENKTEDIDEEQMQTIVEIINWLKNEGFDSSRAIVSDNHPNNSANISYFEMIQKEANQGSAFPQFIIAQLYFQGSEAFPNIHNTLDEKIEKEGNLALYWFERAFQNEDGGLEIRHLVNVIEAIKELRAVGYSSQSAVVEEAIKNGNLQPQQTIENLSLIPIFSTDASYGYSEENPINVGGLQVGAMQQQMFLSALAGPNGEEISFQRIGSCCSFPTPNGFNGTGALDKYEITYAGLSTPIVLYLNLYDSDVLKVPVGFTLKK
jgi:TPR repeat protein